MEMEQYIIQMVMYILEVGKKGKKMEKENLYIKNILPPLMENLKRIKNIMELDINIMKMEIYIMGF